MIVHYVREMTSKKSCKYGGYGSFENLLFLCYFGKCSERYCMFSSSTSGMINKSIILSSHQPAAHQTTRFVRYIHEIHCPFFCVCIYHIGTIEVTNSGSWPSRGLWNWKCSIFDFR